MQPFSHIVLTVLHHLLQDQLGHHLDVPRSMIPGRNYSVRYLVGAPLGRVFVENVLQQLCAEKGEFCASDMLNKINEIW